MPPSKPAAKPKPQPKSTAKGAASKTPAAKPRAKRAARHDHTTIRRALIDLGGNVSAVAEHFLVTRQTVYNWIERYGLRDVVAFERSRMFELAERNIYFEVERGSFEASRFVLTHMPNAGERWSSRSEVTGKDGEPLFAPDVMAALAKMGYTEAEIKARFEASIRQMAATPAATPGEPAVRSTDGEASP